MIVKNTYSEINVYRHSRSRQDNGKVYLVKPYVMKLVSGLKPYVMKLVSGLKPYVMKLVSGLQQFCGFLWELWFSPINKSDHHNKTEILLKFVLNIDKPNTTTTMWVWFPPVLRCTWCHFVIKVNKLWQVSGIH